MKKLLLSLVFLFISLCVWAQQAPVNKIKFESFTRGYKKTVEISPDSVLVEESGANSKKLRRAIQWAEWEQLISALKDVHPANLPGLETKGKVHARDAALHSTITLTTDAGSYSTPTFDNYQAHAKLSDLMEAIKKIEEKAAQK